MDTATRTRPAAHRTAAAPAGRAALGDVRVGVSGWRYEPWRGAFYPKGLVQRRELEYASRQLRTIEINGSFYSLQRPEDYLAWHEATPEDFVFSVKGPKYLTHVRRLREVEQPMADFFASGVLALGAKLGPLLWQLPPTMRFDAERLAAFLRLLPRSNEEALVLAADHDEKVAGRAWLEIDAVRPMRHALEVRHGSFEHPEFIALLREQRVAFVIADTAGRWPEFHDLSADFCYLRLHGATELYNSRYADDEIARWGARIDAWRRGEAPPDARLIAPAAADDRPRDVFCYFDNTDKLHAPDNARSLDGTVRALAGAAGADDARVPESAPFAGDPARRERTSPWT